MKPSAILELCRRSLEATTLPLSPPPLEHVGLLDHEVARLLDGRPSPKLAAHLLVCRPCLMHVKALAGLHAGPDEPTPYPPHRTCSTSLVRHNGYLHVSHSTGAVRHQPALQTRGAPRAPVVWLRDALHDPMAEIAIMANGPRYDLGIRWLDDHAAVDLEVGYPRVFARSSISTATHLISAVNPGTLRARFRANDRTLLDLWLDLP